MYVSKQEGLKVPTPLPQLQILAELSASAGPKQKKSPVLLAGPPFHWGLVRFPFVSQGCCHSPRLSSHVLVRKDSRYVFAIAEVAPRLRHHQKCRINTGFPAHCIRSKIISNYFQLGRASHRTIIGINRSKLFDIEQWKLSKSNASHQVAANVPKRKSGLQQPLKEMQLQALLKGLGGRGPPAHLNN